MVVFRDPRIGEQADSRGIYKDSVRNPNLGPTWRGSEGVAVQGIDLKWSLMG